MILSLILAAVCLAPDVQAAALHSDFHTRDVTIGPPLTASFTTTNTLLAARPGSSDTLSTRTLVPPTTRPLTSSMPAMYPMASSSEIPTAWPSTSITTTMRANNDNAKDHTILPGRKIVPTSPPLAGSNLNAPSPAETHPNDICKGLTSNPAQVNYTQPYTCTVSADFPIFGMYYDSCTLLSLTVNLVPPSSPPPPPPPVIPPSTSPILLPFGAAFTNKPDRQQGPSINPTRSLNVSTPTPQPKIDTTLCCDPTFQPPRRRPNPNSDTDSAQSYPMPATFDTLCVWGKGTDLNDLPPGADTRNITRPAGVVGRCMVSPIFRPMARCVQVLDE